jgi:hypothetical protein
MSQACVKSNKLYGTKSHNTSIFTVIANGHIHFTKLEGLVSAQ